MTDFVDDTYYVIRRKSDPGRYVLEHNINNCGSLDEASSFSSLSHIANMFQTEELEKIQIYFDIVEVRRSIEVIDAVGETTNFSKNMTIVRRICKKYNISKRDISIDNVFKWIANYNPEYPIHAAFLMEAFAELDGKYKVGLNFYIDILENCIKQLEGHENDYIIRDDCKFIVSFRDENILTHIKLKFNISPSYVIDLSEFI